jgi:hypothetical protein
VLERKKRLKQAASGKEILHAGRRAEEDLGIKAMVDEIVKELPPMEKLLKPFYQRVKKIDSISKS